MCNNREKTHQCINSTFHIETILEKINSEIPSYDNNLLNGKWETNYYTGLDDDIIIKVSTGIKNPTEENPISICEFLGKHLNLNFVRAKFITQYGDLPYHYKFPLDAMIKASMIRRIKSLRSFQKLVNRFETNQDDAKIIGFEQNEDGSFKIPDRKTFWHWENVRISTEILENIMDSFIVEIRKELEKNNIKLGRRIGIDATPLEALFKDKDAKYNDYYKMKGYKIHGVCDLDYNIPLAIVITPMNVFDSTIFKYLLDRINKTGIQFEKVYTDSAYDAYEHFALVHMKYNAKFYTRLQENTVYHEKGTPAGIQHEYNRLRNKEDFLPPDKITFEDKLRFLMKYKKFKPVGIYFRNKFIEKCYKKIENGLDTKNLRNAVEGLHGFLKNYLNLQNYLDYKGIRNVERHVRWTYLSILGIALARAQNGITENLTQIAYFE